MLDFAKSVLFDLELITYSTVAQPVLVDGYTKEGPFHFNKIHAGTGAAETDIIGIPDFPIALVLSTDSTVIERGEFFATVYLRMNGERVQKLCAGYVSKQVGISFPASQSDSEFSDRGNFGDMSIDDPAAGANFAGNAPTNQILHIIGATFDFTTDANAADRRVHLQLEMGPLGNLIDCFGATDQAASLTRRYHFNLWPTIPDETDDNDILVPIPHEIWVGSGQAINSSVTNIQVGDQLANITVLFEKFFED